jgi:hypothetical protein
MVIIDRLVIGWHLRFISFQAIFVMAVVRDLIAQKVIRDACNLSVPSMVKMAYLKM